MKKIVLCADGTWNRPVAEDGEKVDPENTNVYKIRRALLDDRTEGGFDRPTDRSAQLVFYDAGVGTDKFYQLRGGAFGIGLSKNIRDLYSDLVDFYEPGDEIYCFGFSRGAYTVRSLVGFVHKCGVVARERKDSVTGESKELTAKERKDLISEAFKLYRKRTDWFYGPEKIAAFKQRYSWDCSVKFLGVWDTVGALGIPVGRLRRLFFWRTQFHDVKLGARTGYAYHAVSIDEKRESFRPTLWETGDHAHQTVEQIWFSGAHANIGGGYGDTGLSDIALAWMVEKAQDAGLVFEPDWKNLESHSPRSTGALIDSRRGIYKILPKIDRFIPNQREIDPIHPSVHERMEKVHTYRPANLRSYFAAIDRLAALRGSTSTGETVPNGKVRSSKKKRAAIHPG